jgi:hypothetical protein
MIGGASGTDFSLARRSGLLPFIGSYRGSFACDRVTGNAEGYDELDEMANTSLQKKSSPSVWRPA